jgi:hypothetical protein
VLDPAGAGIDLLEFLPRLSLNFAVTGEENGARTRGALIECKDESHGVKEVFLTEMCLTSLRRQASFEQNAREFGAGMEALSAVSDTLA